jgi:hypothetical protein
MTLASSPFPGVGGVTRAGYTTLAASVVHDVQRWPADLEGGILAVSTDSLFTQKGGSGAIRGGTIWICKGFLRKLDNGGACVWEIRQNDASTLEFTVSDGTAGTAGNYIDPAPAMVAEKSPLFRSGFTMRRNTVLTGVADDLTMFWKAMNILDPTA